MGYDGVVNFRNGQVAKAPNLARVNGRTEGELAERVAELERRLAVLESVLAVAANGDVTLRGQAISIVADGHIHLDTKKKVFTENLKVKTVEYATTRKLTFYG